jgi:hypothetical protein
MEIQVALEKQRGRHAVSRPAAFFDSDAGIAQHAHGFSRGHALVPKLDGAGNAARQFFGKTCGELGHGSCDSPVADGVSHEHQGYGVLSNEILNVTKVIVDARPLAGRQALCRDAQPVGNSQTDSLRPEIDRQYPIRQIFDSPMN